MKRERVQDHKEKMLAELQLLWKEQCDHLRKKKEQFATEVCSTQLEALDGVSIQEPGVKSWPFQEACVHDTLHRRCSAFSPPLYVCGIGHEYARGSFFTVFKSVFK